MTGRSFRSIEHEPGLARREDSGLGTVYFAPGPERRLVRHLGADSTPETLAAYAEIHRSAQAWLERYWTLEELVRVAQPIELGTDFITWPFPHGNSTRDFDLGDDTPTVPELVELRQNYEWVCRNTRTAGEELVTAILTPHVLLPSTHTLFVFSVSGFVIVDLEPTGDQLDRWAALTPEERRIVTRAEIIGDDSS
jgi:hypothetical protein